MMDPFELSKVHAAIRKYGDDFWNKPSSRSKSWNGYLFDDIVFYLEQYGYDFKLVKREGR